MINHFADKSHRFSQQQQQQVVQLIQTTTVKRSDIHMYEQFN